MEMAAREMIEQRESDWLAPYAMHAADSRGREHRSERDPWRSEFQRDRDRIVHSRAFRRLAHKTQVFISEAGDLFRSRLTHTMEVVQLARTAARRLRLNEDLTECISLVHDLGHPPFGHRGEDMLAELMADYGGFEHNKQTLRIIEDLEIRYPEFPGINLTYEVRESVVKHSAHGKVDLIPVRYRPDEGALLEAQLADQVDAVTYDCHDIDDGLRSGVITLDQLNEVELWRGAWGQAQDESPHGTSNKLLVDRAVRILLDALLGDLVEHSQRQIDAARLLDTNALRLQAEHLIGLSPSMQRAKSDLEAWLFSNLYRDWRVNRTFHVARRQLTDLFGFFVDHSDSLPAEHQARIPRVGLHRAVADYLAGMTDRYAMDEHRKLFGDLLRKSFR